MTEMNEKELELADKRNEYLQRINTGGGDLVPTRYEPRDLPSLMDFSAMVARSGLCPIALQGKPQDVALVLMSGAERGFTAMQALQNMHVVKGKVAMSADIIRAMCQRHPACDGFELLGVTEEKATFQVKKKGWEKSVTVDFSMEDARRAGLIRDGSAWKTFPKAMLVARCTTQAARWYFPDVMAGIMEETEAKELEPEQQLASRPSAKARAAAEAIAGAGKPPEPLADDVVDAEEVEEVPPRPAEGVKERLEAAAEEDAQPEPRLVAPGEAQSAEEAFFGDLQRWVPNVGAKVAGNIIKAGYDSPEKLAAATEDDLKKIDRVGDRMAKDLLKWGKKRAGVPAPAEPEPPPAEDPVAPEEPETLADDALPPTADNDYGKPWSALPSPKGLAQRPVYRGQDWMDGLARLSEEFNVKWSQMVDHAREISGGYDPARLTDPEWRNLIAWIRVAKQEGLFEATRDAEEPPKYELVKEHEKVAAQLDPIDEKQAAQLVRYAEGEGKTKADLEAFLAAEWGYALEALPQILRILMLEWCTSGDYGEVLETMVEGGWAREVA